MAGPTAGFFAAAVVVSEGRAAGFDGVRCDAAALEARTLAGVPVLPRAEVARLDVAGAVTEGATRVVPPRAKEAALLVLAGVPLGVAPPDEEGRTAAGEGRGPEVLLGAARGVAGIDVAEAEATEEVERRPPVGVAARRLAVLPEADAPRADEVEPPAEALGGARRFAALALLGAVPIGFPVIVAEREPDELRAGLTGLAGVVRRGRAVADGARAVVTDEVVTVTVVTVRVVLPVRGAAAPAGVREEAVVDDGGLSAAARVAGTEAVMAGRARAEGAGSGCGFRAASASSCRWCSACDFLIAKRRASFSVFCFVQKSSRYSALQRYTLIVPPRHVGISGGRCILSLTCSRDKDRRVALDERFVAEPAEEALL